MPHIRATVWYNVYMPTTHRSDYRRRYRPAPGITPKQREYIERLLDEKVVTPKPGETLAAIKAKVWHLNKKEASDWISRLKALPSKPTEPAQTVLDLDFTDVPDGRYAVNVTEGDPLEFFRIKRVRDRVFVSRQASDDYHPVRNPNRRAAVLAAIKAVGAQAASARYGHELGKCGVCGRTLTDADSRARGIGPKCARVHGWG